MGSADANGHPCLLHFIGKLGRSRDVAGGGEARLSDIRNRFGDKVADIVASCSDSTANTAKGGEKEDWEIRKKQYLRHLHSVDHDTLLVSLSDKVHNARSILRDLGKHEIGHLIWSRFSQPRDRTLWYHGELAKAFLELVPEEAEAGQLARELGDIVEELKSTN